MFVLKYKGEPHVIVNISEAGADTALNAIAGLMDGGRIELLTGDGEPLVELKLSSPAAMPAADGELVLNEISEGDATRSGEATTARILAADGGEVLSCDVGTVDSDAVIRLGTTQISAGAPVRLNSFRLSMP